MDTKTVAALVVAAALRLAIFYTFPSIIGALSDRVEIATPLSSYKRLLEGLFLYQRNASPYDGGVYHQAPLLLVLFEWVPPASMFTTLDMLNAWNLTRISTLLNLSSPRFQKITGIEIMLAYLFNPFTIMSCLGCSTTILTNATILQAVASASQGNMFGSVFALATGTYLSIYPILLVPPLVLVYSKARNIPVDQRTIVFHLGGLVAVFGVLLTTSTVLVGDFASILRHCYGAQISVTDLTPNIGLWWYFFIEIFDAFRSFFIGVFWLHLTGYVGALTVRLHDQPVFVIIAVVGLITIFKPYPGTADVSLYLGLLPLYKHILPCKSFRVSLKAKLIISKVTRYTFVAAAVLLYSSLLGPAFYHIWIYAGSGNANFFYAITLVWSLGLSMLVGDSIFAVLRDEWDTSRPDMRGKEARQI